MEKFRLVFESTDVKILRQIERANRILVKRRNDLIMSFGVKEKEKVSDPEKPEKKKPKPAVKVEKKK